MTLHRIIDRTFATEEEADVAYEELARLQDVRAKLLVVEVDRFDGNTVRFAWPDTAAQEMMKAIESSYTPVDSSTPCECGHTLELHDYADTEHDNPCHVCQCQGFARADWPKGIPA